jgi:dTDP-4-amino-4,6-dideoxygalactose transaminase
MNKKKFIYFSRSDLGQNEIKSLTKTINSGWLTEGPQNKIFEKNL